MSWLSNLDQKKWLFCLMMEILFPRMNCRPEFGAANITPTTPWWFDDPQHETKKEFETCELFQLLSTEVSNRQDKSLLLVGMAPTLMRNISFDRKWIRI